MAKIQLLALFLWCFGTIGVHGITGGESAKKGEFPFMVSIRTSGNCHICGGTIIGDQWVLTGNPCYALSWFGYISYGVTALDNDCGPVDNATEIKMDDALYNPWASDRAPYTHDQVLIHLSEPIPFSDEVQPIQLAEADEEWPQNGTILGWGGLKWAEKQTDLQKADVPLYSEDYCQQTSLWNGWEPNAEVMKCGGEINQTYYCFMDYGGPLISGGRQFGIMSYVFTTDTEICGGYPGIFSPVTYFRQWIRDTTGI